MSSFQKLADAWRGADMTPKKFVLILVLLAFCWMLAYGVTVGADAGNTSTTAGSTSTAVTTTSTGGP